MVENNPYAEFIPTGTEDINAENNLYQEFIPTDTPDFEGTRLIEGAVPALKFPSFTQPVYLDIQDKDNQKVIYIGDSPFKEDYEAISNDNEKSFFLEILFFFLLYPIEVEVFSKSLLVTEPARGTPANIRPYLSA